MIKKELTILFRGEEIKLSKAMELIDKLNKGTIEAELTEEERKDYNLFRGATNDALTEKEYLIGTLESLIAIQEHEDKTKYN